MVTSVNRPGFPLLESFFSFSLDGLPHRQKLAAGVGFLPLPRTFAQLLADFLWVRFLHEGLSCLPSFWLCDPHRIPIGRQNLKR